MLRVILVIKVQLTICVVHKVTAILLLKSRSPNLSVVHKITYSYFSLEKKTKIAFINSNCNSFFFQFTGCTNYNTIKK